MSPWDSLMFGRVTAPCFGTRPNMSESHSEISTRVPFCIVAAPELGRDGTRTARRAQPGDVPGLRSGVRRGPSRAKTAPRCLWRALLMALVNAGSLSSALTYCAPLSVARTLNVTRQCRVTLSPICCTSCSSGISGPFSLLASAHKLLLRALVRAACGPRQEAKRGPETRPKKPTPAGPQDDQAPARACAARLPRAHARRAAAELLPLRAGRAGARGCGAGRIRIRGA